MEADVDIVVPNKTILAVFLLSLDIVPVVEDCVVGAASLWVCTGTSKPGYADVSFDSSFNKVQI